MSAIDNIIKALGALLTTRGAPSYFTPKLEEAIERLSTLREYQSMVRGSDCLHDNKVQSEIARALCVAREYKRALYNSAVPITRIQAQKINKRLEGRAATNALKRLLAERGIANTL